MHSELEMNETSTFCLGQFEFFFLHLLISLVTMQQVSPVRLAFERIHNLVEFAITVVKPAFS